MDGANPTAKLTRDSEGTLFVTTLNVGRFGQGVVFKLETNAQRPFAQRRLEEAYPYLILDARYEKVREDGTVRSQAVLVAIGINWEGDATFWRSNWPAGKASRAG